MSALAKLSYYTIRDQITVLETKLAEALDEVIIIQAMKTNLITADEQLSLDRLNTLKQKLEDKKFSLKDAKYLNSAGFISGFMLPPPEECEKYHIETCLGNFRIYLESLDLNPELDHPEDVKYLELEVEYISHVIDRRNKQTIHHDQILDILNTYDTEIFEMLFERTPDLLKLADIKTPQQIAKKWNLTTHDLDNYILFDYDYEKATRVLFALFDLSHKYENHPQIRARLEVYPITNFLGNLEYASNLIRECFESWDEYGELTQEFITYMYYLYANLGYEYNNLYNTIRGARNDINLEESTRYLLRTRLAEVLFGCCPEILTEFFARIEEFRDDNIEFNNSLVVECELSKVLATPRQLVNLTYQKLIALDLLGLNQNIFDLPEQNLRDILIKALENWQSGSSQYLPQKLPTGGDQIYLIGFQDNYSKKQDILEAI